MKNFLLTTFAALFFVTVSFAQDEPCIDTTGFGFFQVIYPQPLTEENPEGGITEEAVVGQPFEFTFAIAFPDTLNFPIDPNNPDATVAVQIDSLSFETSGAITYEPPLANFTYTCQPPTCVFYPDELGCVTISGTPTTEEVGTHQLLFTGRADLLLFGLPLTQELTFPDPNLVPGSYPLVVTATSSVVELLSGFQIRNVPNPFSERTDILINSEQSGRYEYRVSDLLGRVLERQIVDIREGDNSISFDGSRLSEGVYLFTLTDGRAVLSQKMVVSR